MNPMKRNDAIDGLRGVTALIIALFHIELYVPFGKQMIFASGYLGVEFFFVLSGFLLAMGYEQKQNSIIKTIKSKIIHLYPPYFCALLLLVAVYSFLWFKGDFFAWINSDFAHVPSIISEVFCLQPLGIFGFSYINGPAWYVSALLMTSLLILLLIKYFHRIYAKYISFILPVTLYLLLFFINPYMSPDSYLIGKIPTAMVRAFAGMSLGTAILYVYTNLKKILARIPLIWTSFIELFLLLFFLRMLLFRQPSRWNYLIFIPISALIIIMFSTGGFCSKLLSTKPFLILGKLSYSFYLMQSVCSNFVLHVLADYSPVRKIIIYLVVNFLTATLLYLIIEKKFCGILREHKWVQQISLFAVLLFAASILINYEKTNNQISEYPIVITALGEENEHSKGSEIWIKGITVDDTFYPATQVFEDVWIKDNTSVGWKEYNRPQGMENLPSVIAGNIPLGDKISVVFESNMWRGKASISILESEYTVDCYNSSEASEQIIPLDGLNLKNQNIGYIVQEQKTINLLRILTLLAWAIFLLGMYFAFVKKKSQKLTSSKNINIERKVWIDILRIFCIFTVVLLHASAGAYTTAFSESNNWYTFLYINCFTSFAVPVLFMVSGSLIIRREESPIRSLFKRLKKILIPLLIWSIAYIVIKKLYLHENISILRQLIKIGIEPQYYHLWFIYTLTGVYLISPLVSCFYYKADKKMLFYSITVFGCLPLILRTFEQIIPITINVSFLYSFFPEVFLFILGKMICDSNNKIFEKWYLWIISGFLGYGFLVTLTYYSSVIQNTPVKTFFSNYGTIPIFIMYVSIFCFFNSMKSKFQMLNEKWKMGIGIVADACMTIYFCHMLIYTFLNNKKILGTLTLSLETNNLGGAFLIAIICFGLSLLVAILLSKIKEAINILASRLYK